MRRNNLKDLGEFEYLHTKNLHLFLYPLQKLPDIQYLKCTAYTKFWKVIKNKKFLLLIIKIKKFYRLVIVEFKNKKIIIFGNIFIKIIKLQIFYNFFCLITLIIMFYYALSYF